jgi:hypothetical protein
MLNIPLSKTAFWDIDMNTLDEDIHKDFIVARVFQYGELEDAKIIIKKYSKKEISHALKNYRGLDDLTINFAKVMGYL